LKAKALEGFLPNIVNEVWVSFRRNKSHIFDKKTEKAIV
jgi:hypothetical protein